MFEFTTIAVILGLVLVVGIAKFAPALIARAIAHAIWKISTLHHEKLVATLIAPRQLPADRWVQTSKEDRKLLAHSFASTVKRTQFHSLFPMVI